MKDAKFIELLNLYVDHQISAADAGLLEAEIQQNPARRQVYRQYCQIQKACVVLTDKFRNEAPAGGQVADSAPGRRRFAPFAYATGLAAAAACVALVLVSRNRLNQQLSVPAAGAQSVAALEHIQPVVARQLAAPSASRPALQPVFQGRIHDGASFDDAFVAANRTPLDWMTRVQFERVPAEELRFDNTQPMPAGDLIFRSRRGFQSRTEGAAFRFQK